MAVANLIVRDATGIKFTSEGELMNKKKSVVGAIILSSAVGLASGPVWSQEAPGKLVNQIPS
jgi:hypothetical protein